MARVNGRDMSMLMAQPSAMMVSVSGCAFVVTDMVGGQGDGLKKMTGSGHLERGETDED